LPAAIRPGWGSALRLVRGAGLGAFEAAPLGHGAADNLEPDRSAFAGISRQAIDKRFLAAGEAGRSALRSRSAGNQDGIVDQAGFKSPWPAQARRDDFCSMKQDRAFFADPVLDQPVSQGGSPLL